MHKNEFQRSVSAFTFAAAITAIVCLFLTGIVYVDLKAQSTLLNAHGMIYPLFDHIITLCERLFEI